MGRVNQGVKFVTSRTIFWWLTSSRFWPKVQCPPDCLWTRKTALITGAQASLPFHQLLAPYLTIFLRRWESNNKRKTPVQNWEWAGLTLPGWTSEPRPQGMFWLLLREPTMKALSNSHAFMRVINGERGTDAKSSVPDRCWRKEVGRKKELMELMEGGNMWRARISEGHNPIRETTIHQSRRNHGKGCS